jgi:hypothetical protein
MSKIDDGKQLEAQRVLEAAKEARRLVVERAFAFWSQTVIMEINTVSVLADMQPSRAMLVLVRDVYAQTVNGMKTIPGLPSETVNDLRCATAIANRIDSYLNSGPGIMVVPANAKVDGKKIS